MQKLELRYNMLRGSLPDALASLSPLGELLLTKTDCVALCLMRWVHIRHFMCSLLDTMGCRVPFLHRFRA